MLGNILGEKALISEKHYFDEYFYEYVHEYFDEYFDEYFPTHFPGEYFGDYYNRMMGEIEIETILKLLPEFLLGKIADLAETPCLLANLIAVDNKLLSDACDFFKDFNDN